MRQSGARCLAQRDSLPGADIAKGPHLAEMEAFFNGLFKNQVI
jgi:hypothetical protein